MKTWLHALFLASCLAASHAEAQSAAAHTPVRAGDVTGLELGLEGATTAVRGAQMTWLLTVHEVVGLDRLRPAVSARVSIQTSYARGAAVFEGTTDAFGRVEARFAVPGDAPENFGVVIETVGRGARRRFELSVATVDAMALEVGFVRAQIAPRQRAGVFGRLSHRLTHRPIADAVVRLELTDEADRPLARPVSVRTDAAGFFTQGFRAPRGVSAMQVRARVMDGDKTRVESTGSIAIATAAVPALLVQLQPEKPLIRPGEGVYVDVVVRLPNGAPVPNATLEASWSEAASSTDPRRRVRTDARGRARLRYDTQTHAEQEDHALSVTARREGIGAGFGVTTVRVDPMRYAAALAAEGGTFPEAIGGKIFVRVVSANGSAAPEGVAVSLGGPRIPEGLTGKTDIDGVAVFDVALRPARAAEDGESDTCGGATATLVEATIGAAEGSVRGCVPLDPDATVRVRVSAPVVRFTRDPRAECASVDIAIARAPAASGLPVAITLLSRSQVATRPFMADVLAANATSITKCIPRDAVGHVVVRARPLFGPDRLEVRGGSASLWVRPSDALDVAASLDADSICVRPSSPQSIAVALMPIAEARQLLAGAQQITAGFLPDLRTPTQTAHEALLSAALAVVTPFDLAAPAVLRDRIAVDTPAPTNPETLGLLRDPWRSRARFVSGRLGIVFQALEAYVESAVPERIEDVGVQVGGRWQFNALVLDAVAHSDSLGDAGATGLGGEPLTIAQLQRLDPELTYDNVAKRITRKRLFLLILAMREFVRARGLDLRWSNRADPAEWLSQLQNEYLEELGAAGPAPRELVDGWGHPFVARETGGRTRFPWVEPVAGVEIVSVGPDGRVGTGDDVFDPTARVLSSNSLYGRAVAEDVLLGRLRGVELGRATAELAAEIFGQDVPTVPAPDESDATQGLLETWSALPTVLDPEPEPLAVRRPADPSESEVRIVRTSAPTCVTSPLLASSAAPETWGLVAFSGDDGGETALAFAHGSRGAPLLLHGALPDRVRVDEPVRVRLDLTNLEQTARDIEIAVSVSEGISVQAPATIRIPAEETRAIELTLEGKRVGTYPFSLQARRAGSADAITRSVDVSVDRGLHPVMESAGGLAWEDRILDTRLRAAESDEHAEGHVTVFAPSAFADADEFARIRREDPSLIAWGIAASGRAVDDDLRARVLRSQRPDGAFPGAIPSLSTAAALLALGSLGAEDPDAVAAFERARTVIESNLPGDNTGTAAQAAVVAALALSGAAESADDLEDQTDPIAGLLTRLRANLRGSLRRDRAEPTLLARAAAALLAADPRDRHGIAMLDLASQHLENTRAGARLVTTTARAGEAERLASTAALALAAHQAGREALARRLASEALLRTDVAASLGGETAFWMLALSAYGVLGAGEPDAVQIAIDGREQTVALEQGRASMPLDPHAPHAVQVRAFGNAAVYARAQIVSSRSFSSREDAPIRLAIAGDPGRAGGVAALEIVLSAAARIDRPILEIQLPAGVRATDPLLGAIRSTRGVASVSARDPGWIRVEFAPLDASTTLALPLPLAWQASGRLTGLGAVAYAEDAPEIRTTLAPRIWEIAPPVSDASPGAR